MRLTEAERIAWLTLAVARWDHAAARRGISSVGGSASFLAGGEPVWRACGCNKDAVGRLHRAVLYGSGAEEAKEAEARGIRILFPGDEGYPARLVHLEDPPVALYARGSIASLSHRGVAIVGTRAASPEAMAWADAAGRISAEAGLAVFSGGARGIDGAAHRGALAARESAGSAAPTIAVLGGGLLRPYPHEHAPLFDRIAASGGCVVTESPLTAPPMPETFPRRNRLIAALAEAVVVVEAPHKSGAQNTVSHALALGREVLATPWPAGPRRDGSNALLAEGARAVASPDEIPPALGLAPRSSVWVAPQRVRPSGPAEERRLVEMENKGRATRLPDGEFLVG